MTVREGKNLKGRLLGLVLGTVGKRVLVDAFETSDQGDRGSHRRSDDGSRPPSTSPRGESATRHPGTVSAGPVLALVL